MLYLVVGQDQAGQWYEVSQTEATNTMLELSIRPMKAMIPARTSRRRKSKENSAPA